MLPQSVIELLNSAFPTMSISAPTATVGGFSHQAALLMIGEQRCVVKAADTPTKRADLRREAQMLALLQGRGLPTPALLTLIEQPPWTVAVLHASAGAQGLQILVHAPAEREPMYRALGNLLATVHRMPLAQPPTPDWRLAERFRQVLAALPTLTLDSALRDDLQTSLKHPAWQSAACLVHGDAGAHNLLWDGQITALLDWEWSGWGNPLLDLAWVYWTMRWRNVPNQLWPAFLAGYGHTSPLGSGDGGALRALALGQIAGLLVRVHDQPDAWMEWLRRARWTMALPFPD
jgi:aminoglycoside phosphotransferase (APT) family kinase protein